MHKILDGKELLQDSQYHKSTWKLFNGSRPTKGFLSDFGSEFSKLPKINNRKPTVLILGNEIQALPWEALKSLDAHPISRVPSIHTLAILHQTHINNSDADTVPNVGKVREDKIFYVLNPDKNLAKTEARLAPTLTGLGAGIIGKVCHQL